LEVVVTTVLCIRP